jgi:transaldolase
MPVEIKQRNHSVKVFKQLGHYGQSIWLDYISRQIIRSGELKRMVEEDGLTGVTTNPSLFEKAIDGSHDYDQAFERLLVTDTNIDAQTLYERLSVEDVQMAADVLRPVYDHTRGRDGFVSMEVSPYLAHDTQASVVEAQRLWDEVSRPNLLVKIPATEEGIPVIDVLIAKGINVNVTLIFSRRQYEAVMRAFLSGIENAPDPTRTISVASVFVSPIDAIVDSLLEKTGSPEALGLRGKIGIANAKLIYREFKSVFYSARFAGLRLRRVPVQRVLWGSTGTRNLAYSDVMYVEELIGPDTINTVPPATLNAFRDHGYVRGPTLEEEVTEAEAALNLLSKMGIDLNAVAESLQADGVMAFAASMDKLLATINRKSKALQSKADNEESPNYSLC